MLKQLWKKYLLQVALACWIAIVPKLVNLGYDSSIRFDDTWARSTRRPQKIK